MIGFESILEKYKYLYLYDYMYKIENWQALISETTPKLISMNNIKFPNSKIPFLHRYGFIIFKFNQSYKSNFSIKIVTFIIILSLGYFKLLNNNTLFYVYKSQIFWFVRLCFRGNCHPCLRNDTYNVSLY